MWSLFKNVVSKLKNTNLSESSLTDAISQLSKEQESQSSTSTENNKTSVTSTSHEYEVGDIAKKYESNNRGPGFISSGSKWGDPGGDSYGSYQLETRMGTMQEYLISVNDKFTAALRPLKINTMAFKRKWKELANDDPEGFEQSQFTYLAKKPGGYYNALNYAKNLGWNTDSFAMKSAIYSTVNQSGNWKVGIFDKSGIDPSDSIEVQINKLYDARAKYFRSLRSLTKEIKDNIIKNRTVDERKDVLKLVDK